MTMDSAIVNSNEIVNPSNINTEEAPVSLEESSSSSEEQPKPNDVLLGRASHIYNHPGNIRYRSIIASNQRKYHSCTTRLDKMIFIRQITKDILEDGSVKFWKMNKKGGGKLWKEVNFRTVQDKVSHALRDGKNTNDSQLPFVDVIPPDYHKMEPTRPNRFPSPASKATATTTTMNNPPIKSSLLSHIDQVLLSRSRDFNASLADSLHKHHIVEDLPASARDYQSLAFADRQHNLRLASMASALQQDRKEQEFATAQHLHALQQHRSADRGIGSTQVFSPSTLLEHSTTRSSYADKDSFLMNDSHHNLMNQSNTVSQQLSPDDFLLHAMRKQRSLSNAPASAAAAAYAAVAARAESATNQRVYGTRFPRKNLHSPPITLPAMVGGNKITGLREQSLIETLQKLKSQRVAEIQALEEQLRNVQN
eukprot:CAMPEP_0178916556 /NCGR_PEP_ID=MMETSP0786-20121207/12716_1 /TAXON_ID=186022 /ORGANISM="Thalassionema frauenfeldii, Strain CCMP 1798" /LENGTH=422 /DNA_ID=CAMNT_0020589927 /DNA_START=62 /DNA_END=1330 /DNA_ORIENTATION=+